MKFLFTFETTTAAFKAEKALGDADFVAHAETVPFELSKTCYGIGVSFESEVKETAVDVLGKEDIAWRRLWQKNSDGEFSLAAEKES